MPRFLELIQEYQYFGLLAFFAAVFLTPVAMRLAFRYRVLDMPDQLLKPHARPIPYLGGVAICAAWALALLLAMGVGRVDWHLALPVLLGGVALSAMGLLDDIRHLPPKLRLAIGAVIILAVMLSTGTGSRLLHSLLWPGGIRVALELTTPVSILIGLVLVLGACNSTNLIDGLDGLCTGVTAIISLGFFLLASHLELHEYSQKQDPLRLVLSLSLLGAALGFLPWNFNPAKIFMGDAGSVLLGYNCGIMILLFAEKGIARWVFGALMIFAVPVFDTLLAMFRRWRSGRSIFEGDRSHFYDQLVQRGLSVKQTVLVCYGLTLLYGAIGMLSMVVRTRYSILIFVGVCIATALGAWAAGLTRPEEPRAGANPKPAAAQPPG